MSWLLKCLYSVYVVMVELSFLQVIMIIYLKIECKSSATKQLTSFSSLWAVWRIVKKYILSVSTTGVAS